MAVCDEQLRDTMESALASVTAAVDTARGLLASASRELAEASQALLEAEVPA